MTKTEIKAKEKAEELITKYKDLAFGLSGDVLYKNSVKCSILVCDEVISTLSSIKGMAKISKLTFWKKVKENLK